ncbi:MAG: sorbosone dehydrogenase family protein [Hyphomonadaceae bacterium]
MRSLVLVFAFAASGCAGSLPESATYGPEPQLVAPNQPLIPDLGVPRAVGWPDGAAPHAADGFVVTRFAEALDHPRWIYLLPNGDVLVAESSTEPGPARGLMGWIKQRIQDRAGALNESADRITLLRDADGDGVAEDRSVFLQNLNQPFGMALVGDSFYVGNTDAVMRFPYHAGDRAIASAGEQVMALPHNPGNNGHWTRALLASADGSKLYVGVGSVSNVGDSGMDVEEGRAAIHELDLASGRSRVFASGLRNPNGMDWEPATGRLWTAVNERDFLGPDLVPDYMTSVQDGGFYGWPWTYWGRHPDPRFEDGERPAAFASRALTPDYALGAHTASLGLVFYDGQSFPAHYRGGAFIGQHGSWNRAQPSGYKVLFVPFANGAPSGQPEDFLTGFLNERGQAMGRPVGVALDRTGALLVADDAGNMIWRVAPGR